MGLFTALGALAVALMMVHIAADVAAKALFSTPLPGTIAIVSQYYMVAIVFIPLAFAERRSLHISVEVVAERLPDRVQDMLAVASALLSALVYAALALRGWEEASRAAATGLFIIEQDVRVDTWPARWLMPAGAAMMLAALVFKLARRAAGGRDAPLAARF